RVAGPGNYILMGEDGILNDEEEEDFEDDDYDEFDEDEDEDEDDYEEEEENPFAPMDFEEKKERFLNITSQMEEFDEEESIYLYRLCQSLIGDLLDEDAYNQWIDTFDAELGKIGVNDDTIPDEMLGKAPGQAPFHQKIKVQFLEILEISAPMETKKTLFDAFCTNPGVEAAAAYLELALAEQEQSKKYASLLKKAAKKYPGYSLIQIRRAESEILDADPQKDHSISRLFNDFFFGRDAIHPFEFHALLHLKTQALAAEQNLEKTEAWKNILDHYIQESNMAHIMTTIVSLLQIPMIAIRLEKEQNRKG
nr:hypothetical protein [Prolixibacteraceae bacterium]